MGTSRRSGCTITRVPCCRHGPYIIAPIGEERGPSAGRPKIPAWLRSPRTGGMKLCRLVYCRENLDLAARTRLYFELTIVDRLPAFRENEIVALGQHCRREGANVGENSFPAGGLD